MESEIIVEYFNVTNPFLVQVLKDQSIIMDLNLLFLAIGALSA